MANIGFVSTSVLESKDGVSVFDRPSGAKPPFRFNWSIRCSDATGVDPYDVLGLPHANWTQDGTFNDELHFLLLSLFPCIHYKDGIRVQLCSYLQGLSG